MYNSAKGSGGFPVSHKSLPCTNFTSKIPTGGFPSEPVAANMAAFLRGNIWRFSLMDGKRSVKGLNVLQSFVKFRQLLMV